MQDLFNSLCAQFPGMLSRNRAKPQYLITCPYCGAESRQTNFHCSFGQIFPNEGWGFKCFSCGEVRSLKRFAIEAGAIEQQIPKPLPVSPPKPQHKPIWLSQKQAVCNHVVKATDKYDLWYEYKRVTPDMVDKYRLGVGVLPSCQCKHHRLITPFFEHDNPVWFRGRRVDCDCNNWLGASGVSPYDISLPGIEDVPQNGIVFVTENRVDAMLITEKSPYYGVATLSTSYWCDKWTKQLRAAKPSQVIVLFDADLPGNGLPIGDFQQAVKRRIVKRFHVEHPVIVSTLTLDGGWLVEWQAGETSGEIHIPQPAGVKLANRLLGAGIKNVTVGKWQEGELGLDVGQLYVNSLGE